MKILLAAPRWRSVYPCAEDFQADVLVDAYAEGHAVARVPGYTLTGCAVYHAREIACDFGLSKGFDVVLFCDADARLDTKQAIEMCKRAVRYDFAILGAPVDLRGGIGMGFSLNIWDGEREAPATVAQMERLLTCIRNRECWATDGHVATTVSVVNLRHLRDIPRPWFLPEPDARERAKRPSFTTTDDVWFCIRAHKARKKVGVDFAARDSEHWTAQCLKGAEALERTEAKLAASLEKMRAEAMAAVPEMPRG